MIISPYFPPTNAADMQRVRTSLPYFRQSEWSAEVVTVAPVYSDLPVDELLSESLDPDVPIHYVAAFSKKITQKFGLGSIALRSLYFYRKKVNALLTHSNFDLIFFSTTQFPVCSLGPYWKRKFNIPYVIDMQDPWFSEYYQDKPRSQRPKKHWFSYRLNRYLERVAMGKVDGLISVSDNYIADLKNRYPEIKNTPAVTLTFGAFSPDIDIAVQHHEDFKPLLATTSKNLVYIGRGGYDMIRAIKPLFSSVKTALAADPDLSKKLRLYFIGTSYAPAGLGIATITPIAREFGLEGMVTEITDRIGYYHALSTLKTADGIFIPGSDDASYTPSKIYQQLLINKPVLGIFNKKSPAIKVLKEYGVSNVYDYDNIDQQQIIDFLKAMINDDISPVLSHKNVVKKYTAEETTLELCSLFNKVI